MTLLMVNFSIYFILVEDMDYVIEGGTRELQRQKVRNEYTGNDVVHNEQKKNI